MFESTINAYPITGPDRQAPSTERKEKTMDSTFSCNYTPFRALCLAFCNCRQRWFNQTLLLLVVLEKTLENPLDCKEIQPVQPKGDQSWVFFARTDFEAETPILWPPDAKSWLIWKDPDTGKDSGQEEKGMTEDEMAGWHHWLNGHGFGWTPGVGDGQGGLTCCVSWGRKELYMTERLNWTELRGFLGGASGKEPAC